VPLEVKNHLIQTAKELNLSTQYEVWPRGQSDAGAIQLSVDGIAIGGVSYPARFVGGNSTVVDLADVNDALKLVVAAAASYEA
jgi:endoglucanase